jgi:hypothetical protein
MHDANCELIVTCQTSHTKRHNHAQIGGNPLQMRFVRSAQNLRYQHETKKGFERGKASALN